MSVLAYRELSLEVKTQRIIRLQTSIKQIRPHYFLWPKKLPSSPHTLAQEVREKERANSMKRERNTKGKLITKINTKVYTLSQKHCGINLQFIWMFGEETGKSKGIRWCALCTLDIHLNICPTDCRVYTRYDCVCAIRHNNMRQFPSEALTLHITSSLPRARVCVWHSFHYKCKYIATWQCVVPKMP